MRLPNLLATRRGRLTAFTLLYVTEGIPSGFATTAIATYMRRQGLDPVAIGAFIGAGWAMGLRGKEIREHSIEVLGSMNAIMGRLWSTQVAGLINGTAAEIAITDNVTNGMSYIANGITLQAGDEIVPAEVGAVARGRSPPGRLGQLDHLLALDEEYPAVVIPVLTQHYTMLQRNLLYTGVTRGKRLVVLVGQKKAVAIAVKNVSGRRRWSKLDEWLIDRKTP